MFCLLGVGQVLGGGEGALVAVGPQTSVAHRDGVGFHDAEAVVIGHVTDEELVPIWGHPAEEMFHRET